MSQELTCLSSFQDSCFSGPRMPVHILLERYQAEVSPCPVLCKICPTWFVATVTLGCWFTVVPACFLAWVTHMLNTSRPPNVIFLPDLVRVLRGPGLGNVEFLVLPWMLLGTLITVAVNVPCTWGGAVELWCPFSLHCRRAVRLIPAEGAIHEGENYRFVVDKPAIRHHHWPPCFFPPDTKHNRLCGCFSTKEVSHLRKAWICTS